MSQQTKDVQVPIKFPRELAALLMKCPGYRFPASKKDLVDLALGGAGQDEFEVVYDVPGKGRVSEAVVHRCRNGVSANYQEIYMRRRDPDCMVVSDDLPSDKPKYRERFSVPFSELREEIFEWLGAQELVLLPFYAGGKDLRCESLLVAPLNAAFFACALADLQGMVPRDEIPGGFHPKVVIYLAPTFRHTHCQGRQVVIHDRQEDSHQIFSLNLYPGPSAKKGIYGVLLNLGEKQGWVTAHGSTVKITTPYDNEFVIMHEGASGGGKSEMLQYPHREPDGRLLIAENILTGKKRYLPLFQGCSLAPVTDDMALCHPSLQNESGRLVVQDAEEGWFVRVNHIDHYGVDRYLEKMCVHPKEPLVFLNLYSVPGATCLIWEHTMDSPGHPCPNPRVILPRKCVPDIVNEAVEVHVRSFGVRTPPCTKERPTYGIIGMLHLLPPSLGWLWRLVAPRGHDNPSITDTAGMSSEGVGSYWPFATGRKVDQANLLLEQILQTPKTRFVLCPNQYIGAWKVGFMPQWLAREYLARRGSAHFKPHQLDEARCPLLGYAVHSMQIEGLFVNRDMLEVSTQEDVGNEAYDKGAAILREFFHNQLRGYLDEKDLHPLGRKIIQCCFEDGKVSDYAGLIQA